MGPLPLFLATFGWACAGQIKPARKLIYSKENQVNKKCQGLQSLPIQPVEPAWRSGCQYALLLQAKKRHGVQGAVYFILAPEFSSGCYSVRWLV